MSAQIPRFGDDDFPLADALPRVCPWCHGPQLTTLRGPREARWAVNEHPDRRTCDSNRHRPSKYVRTTHCYHVNPDLTAVVLDRVAELPRRWTRVRVGVDCTPASRPEFLPRIILYAGTPDLVTAICHAYPTDSQHLAECLMHDPEIDNLLRDVREKHAVPVADQRFVIPYLSGDFVGAITSNDETQVITMRDFQ